MPNRQPENKNDALSKRRATNLDEIKSEGNFEVGPFIEIESALETVWPFLEPALFERFDTYGQIPKEEPILAIELCLGSSRDPHLCSIGLSRGLTIA